MLEAQVLENRRKIKKKKPKGHDLFVSVFAHLLPQIMTNNLTNKITLRAL